MTDSFNIIKSLNDTMVGKTILGLFGILVIGMMIIPAFADIVPSPYKQLQSGVPLNMIQCSVDKILLKSPSGKPACLTIQSSTILADRGYSFVSLVKKIIPEKELVPLKIITVKSTVVNSESEIVTSYIGVPHQPCTEPTITLNLPNRVKVDEIFDVNVSFKFPTYNQKKYNPCYETLAIRYPPNYTTVGNNAVAGFVIINDHYLPSFITHGSWYHVPIKLNNPPISFQMKISETNGTEYDFGNYDITLDKGNIIAVVYTSILDGHVYFSNKEFINERAIDENTPIFYGNNNPKIWIGIKNNQTDEGYVPFKSIPKGIERNFGDPIAIEFIKRFGFDYHYILELSEAYPQYKTQAFNPVAN